MHRWGRAIAAAVLAVAALTAPATSSSSSPARPSATSPPVGAPRSVAPTGVVPAATKARYLSTQPGIGPVTVIDVSGESGDRKLLAATLQGIVNRTTARIYLVGMRSSAEDQHWLDDYQARGLITIAAHLDLDAAIHAFKGEVAGYVLASDAEPWTINTATSAAGALGGVVATAATAGVLQAEGLTQLASHVGRWPDAATGYEGAAALYRGSLAYDGVAIESPSGSQPRDFLVQQGVFTVYTRPSHADYDRVYDLIETFPTTHPVYGYIADDGGEEVEAIVRLSRTGHFLVPTDTTDNLSFHVAVGGATRTLPKPSTASVAPCTTSTVNVVVAFSDGDNMVIPEAYLARDDRWGSARRGEVALGWGISPAAAVLMPAIWDSYVATATDQDEIVDIMGLGYALPSLMPNGAAQLADGMRLRAALGVATHWSLDALISKPDAAGWAAVHQAAAATGAAPAAILLNYERWPGPAWYRTSDQIPVLASQQTSYGAGAADIASQVQTLVDAPPAQRSLVTFIPATVWQSTYDQLADALAPLAAKGVRFLTPSQAAACLPPPQATPTTTTTTTATTDPGSTSTTAMPAGPAGAAAPVGGAPSYVG